MLLRFSTVSFRNDQLPILLYAKHLKNNPMLSDFY